MGTKFQTDGGKKFPATDFYYVPDPKEPSTWKLRRTGTPGGEPDATHVSGALEAITTGYRGKKADIPDSARAGILAAIRPDWKKTHPGEELPTALKKKAIAKMQPGMGQVHVNRPLGSDDDGAGSKKAKKNKNKVNGALSVMYRNVLKNDEESRYSLGVVYEPDAVDTQGDFAKAADIQKAAWKFGKRLYNVAKASREIAKALLAAGDGNAVQINASEKTLRKMAADLAVAKSKSKKVQKGALGLQHAYWGDELGDIVESYIAPQDMTINGQIVKAGSWLMGVVWSPEAWEMVKSGKITGYSMGGKAKKAAA